MCVHRYGSEDSTDGSIFCTGQSWQHLSQWPKLAQGILWDLWESYRFAIRLSCYVMLFFPDQKNHCVPSWSMFFSPQESFYHSRVSVCQRLRWCWLCFFIFLLAMALASLSDDFSTYWGIYGNVRLEHFPSTLPRRKISTPQNRCIVLRDAALPSLKVGLVIFPKQILNVPIGSASAAASSRWEDMMSCWLSD